MITAVLRHRFIFAPLRLSSLIDKFDGLEYVARFYRLAREYLPESYEDLLKREPHEAAVQFVKIFSKRYFMIEPVEYGGSVYEDGRFIKIDLLHNLIRSIPFQWHGFRSWDYEEFYRMPKAQLLAEVVCRCAEERMSRLAVLDQFIKTLKAADAKLSATLLPKKGYELEDLERILAESPYAGLLDWCRWLFGRTGNLLLDEDRATLEWTRENVERLTRAWPGYLETDKHMKDFDRWLSQDFAQRAEMIIKYITGKVGKPLIEVFGEENDNQNKTGGRAAVAV